MSSLLFPIGHCQGMGKWLQFASDAKPRRSKNYWVEMLKTPPVCSARGFRSPGRILPLSEDKHHFSRTSPAPSYSCNSTTAPQILSRRSRVITRFLRANISLHFPQPKQQSSESKIGKPSAVPKKLTPRILVGEPILVRSVPERVFALCVLFVTSNGTHTYASAKFPTPERRLACLFVVNHHR